MSEGKTELEKFIQKCTFGNFGDPNVPKMVFAINSFAPLDLRRAIQSSVPRRCERSEQKATGNDCWWRKPLGIFLLWDDRFRWLRGGCSVSNAVRRGLFTSSPAQLNG